MNKYVVRTSIVWMGIVAIILAESLFKRSHKASAPPKAPPSTSLEVQPVAEGPAADTSADTSKGAAEQPMQTPLMPVQITPERMQSIGVETGTVEYKQLDNDVRATGNVDIDQRLVSTVQVRFPGYISKVFANAICQSRPSGIGAVLICAETMAALHQTGWRYY